MKQYIDKSALVAELNRLIAELVEEGEGTMFEQGRISAFEDVKVFINHTLKVKEVEEETISKDLEEAANNYPSAINTIAPQWSGEIKNAFKAGAQWQKEQMMKDAFECKIDWYDGCVLGYTQEQLDNTIEALGLEVNDKIKVIIIKEE